MLYKIKKKVKQLLNQTEQILIKTLKLIAEKNGYFLVKKHFYSAIPEKEDLPSDYWQRQSDLMGITIDSHKILQRLEAQSQYILEFRDKIPLYQDNNEGLYLINSSFMAIDAHIYYSFIRSFKPTRIIEIGSGYSTLFANLAIQQNETHTNLTAIDPYPSHLLKDLSSQHDYVEIIPKKLQDIDLDLFSSLQANDILFIDSTHMLRTGSDVQVEYCEILPRLAPGVLVHIHDISLPKHYPSVYFENELYWNEQYLLQAFLAFNSGFEIIWPGNYMMLNHPNILLDIFPEFKVMRQHFPLSEPSSFWMQVKHD